MPHPQTRDSMAVPPGLALDAENQRHDVVADIVNIAARMQTAVTSLAQIVANTGGVDNVNLESISLAIQVATEANRDYNAASKTNLDALVSLQTAARDALLAIENTSAASATDLAALEVINTDIRTAVQLIDDYVGTHDAVAPDALAIIGGVAEETVPAAVADGDAVRINYDPYGRHRDAAFNQAQSSEDTTETAPAVMQVGEFPFTQLTAPGSTPAAATQDYRNHTFQILLDIGGCTDVVVRADGSLDGTNWAPLGVVDDDCVVTNCAVANEELTITASGTYFLRLQNLKTKYIRLTFVSEAGDTDATLDVDLMSGI